MKPKPGTYLWALLALILGSTAGALMFCPEWPLRIFGACVAIALVVGAQHERVEHWFDDKS